VVGSPRLDRIVRSNALASRERLCRRFGLDPRRSIVLYFPTFVYGRKRYISYNYPRSDSRYFEIQRRIVVAFRDFPEVQLLFKQHQQTSKGFPIAELVRDQAVANCTIVRLVRSRLPHHYVPRDLDGEETRVRL
jgi:hypothetical protein